MSEGSQNELPPEEEKIDTLKQPESKKERSEIEEKRKKVFELYKKLGKSVIDNYGFIGGTDDYTLVRQVIGARSFYNTLDASKQLMIAMALSQNQLVEELADTNFKRKSPEEQKKIFQNLVENQVLKNLKVLDFGCGAEPTFARIARALGADVYTVDIIATEKFITIVEESDREVIHQMEAEKHIQLDLAKPNASEVIKNRSGGNFDLVTSANASTPPFHFSTVTGQEIASSLLKEDGIYFPI